MEGVGDNGVEFNLAGLPMNGGYGVLDPSGNNLRRSSSVSDLPADTAAGSSTNENGNARGVPIESHAPPLVRTRSENDEWRRRKEERVAKCVEARRKRMDKLKNARVNNNNNNNNNNDGNEAHGNHVNGGENGIIRPSSRRTVGLNMINGSSGNADLDNQHMGGPRQIVRARHLLAPQVVIQEPAQIAAIRAPEADAMDLNELLTNTINEMPFVSTMGNGPDHRKIEGFLYRYKADDAYKIVCVCHGDFLTPAEFVRHGGGGDVENPLRHIVVNNMFPNE